MKSYERLLTSISDRIALIGGRKLSDAQIEEKYLCENSLYLFVEKAWPIIEGAATFIPGWHAQAICEHLEALYNLDITHLLINCPPRIGKSNICSVLLCAWVWTKQPHLRFLYSSYAQSLSVRDSIKCRRLIQSEWYQSLWGDTFFLTHDVNNKLRFENSATGYRIASSVGGANTGEGGHFEVSDDPNNVLESESEVIRESTNEWHDFVMCSRYSGTLAQFRRLVVQQRVHSRDVSGNILSKNDSRWVHLCLPMEFERNRRCITIPLRMAGSKTWRDPRKTEGELLWPAGVSRKALDELKQKDFRGDSYRIAGQLQQTPSPSEGGIIKKEWFQVWKEKEWPNFDYILQSWDTALAPGSGGKTKPEKATNAYSACTTWGVFNDSRGVKNIMLLSLYKDRIEYPELRKMATRLAHNFLDTDPDDPLTHKNPVDLVLIEAKVSGYSLASDLERANIPIMRFNPNTVGDKIARCRRVTDLMENGLVWLPTIGPKFEYLNEYSQLFIQDAILFPSGESNDVIDSMSQALIRLKQTGWAENTNDPTPIPKYEWETWKRPTDGYYSQWQQWRKESRSPR